MDRMIGDAKSRLWWVAGIFCALLVGLAGCGKDEKPPAPKYGGPRPKPKTVPVTPEKPKAPAAKPEAPAEKPSETQKKG